MRQTRGKKGPRKTRKQGKRKGGKTRKRVMGKRGKRTMRKVRRGGMVPNPFVRTKKQRMEKLVTQFEKLKQRVISGHERATVLSNKISSDVEFDDNIRTHIAEFVNCRDVYDHLHNGRKYKTFKDLVTKEDNAPPELKTLCEKVMDLKSKVDKEMDVFSQVAVALENSSPLKGIIGTTLFERRSYFNPRNKDVLSKVVPPPPPEVDPPKAPPPPPEVDPPKAPPPPPNYGLYTLDDLFKTFKKDEYNYYMFKPNKVRDRTIKTWVRLVKKETEEGLNSLFILLIEFDVYHETMAINADVNKKAFEYKCVQSNVYKNLYHCNRLGGVAMSYFDLRGDEELRNLDMEKEEKLNNDWEDLKPTDTDAGLGIGGTKNMQIIEWMNRTYPRESWPSDKLKRTIVDLRQKVNIDREKSVHGFD